MTTTLTQHAQARIRQRGLRESDLALIVAAGTPVDGDSLLLLAQDVEREIRRRKQEIGTLERLRGCRIVLAGEAVVTVYRPSRKTEKRLLRGGPRRPCQSDPSPRRSGHPGDQGHAA
jgi:hypothetical protein